MVLPVGGFFPIPLAMMIPFMATQSLVMGEAFGKAFQFGKRKISAMSNDEFNKLSIENVASEMFASYKNILPELKTSIADSSDFQNHIFAQLILLGPNLIKALGGAVLTDTQEKIDEALPKPDETAADVFKETEPVLETQDFKPDVFHDIANAVQDLIPPLTIADYYKRLVYNVFIHMINPSLTAAQILENIRKNFFTGFSSTLVKTLVVIKVVEKARFVKNINGTNQVFGKYWIYYHL